MAQLVAATKRVHESLVAGLDLVRDRLGERAGELVGLCATGAYMLRDELARLGLDAHIVIARAVYGNACHVWVELDGVHADPTHLQFDARSPWRVSAAPPPVTYHGEPCTWAREELPERWSAKQHPQALYPLLGLGTWSA